MAMSEPEARRRAIEELGEGYAGVEEVVGKLVDAGEYDILHHLYKHGPKGKDLFELLHYHCFGYWDLFMLDLTVRKEKGL